jgi:hypothetical protein
MALPHDGQVRLVRVIDADGNPVRVFAPDADGVNRFAVNALISGGALDPTPNRPDFFTDQKNVAVPGTAEQLPSHVIPDGFQLVIQAKKTNTDLIYVSNSQVNAQNPAVAKSLAAGEGIGLFITNSDIAWIDAVVAGEGVEFYAEV